MQWQEHLRVGSWDTALPWTYDTAFMSISLSNASGTEITIEKSTAYVQSWLKALKSDERMAFVASQAQRAADHITNV
ncbi:MAG: hypothetical protein QGI09_07950 [Dehalococcoidia bacterium]|nr:hypothetical protein [Dehalococcoidia bacterium]